MVTEEKIDQTDYTQKIREVVSCLSGLTVSEAKDVLMYVKTEIENHAIISLHSQSCHE